MNAMMMAAMKRGGGGGDDHEDNVDDWLWKGDEDAEEAGFLPEKYKQKPKYKQAFFLYKKVHKQTAYQRSFYTDFAKVKMEKN
jgi:hypothetical protein